MSWTVLVKFAGVHSHAAVVGVATVLHRECSGMRTPLSKTRPWAQFMALPKRLFLLPPCGLGPLPWRPCLGWGSGAPPFCFPLFFPLFRSLLKVTPCRAALAKGCCGHPFWLKPLRFDCTSSQERCGIVSSCRKQKTLYQLTAPLCTPPLPNSTKVWA